jgi:hypothetical protein
LKLNKMMFYAKLGRIQTNGFTHGKKTSTSKIENEEINDPDQESCDNDSFQSLDSEEEDDEGSPR